MRHHQGMRPYRLALPALLLALCACGSPTAPEGTPPRSSSTTGVQPAATSSSPPADSAGRPMSDVVLDRIATLTDCADLQAEFDQADANGHLGYMEAADARMREVGCYG